MEIGHVRIPAQSRSQAMDWSLVLVSQELESIIDYSADQAGWGLLVPEVEGDRAREVLRLYQEENRRWPWRRELFQPGLVFDWASLGWCLLLCIFFWLSETHEALRAAGLMDGAAVARGEWWRCFTAAWLHADIAHLAGNATLGFVLLGLCMARYGTGAGFFAAYLAGAGGNLVAFLLSPRPHYSLGASGVVMAALGLLAARSFSLWRQTPQMRKYVLTGAMGGVMLFVLLGLSPGNTDIIAHAGGFASGLALGVPAMLFLRSLRRPSIQVVFGLLGVLLTIGPWWLALHRLK